MPTIPSRQVISGKPTDKPKTQAKTFFYNFRTNEVEPAVAGRPTNTPYYTDARTTRVRFRSVNQSQAESSHYFDNVTEDKLKDWGGTINFGAYGAKAQTYYQTFVKDLEKSGQKDIEGSRQAVDKIIKLMNVTSKFSPEGGGKISGGTDADISDAIETAFGRGKVIQPLTQLESEYITPAMTREPSLAQPPSLKPQRPNKTVSDMMLQQKSLFGGQSEASSMNDPPQPTSDDQFNKALDIIKKSSRNPTPTGTPAVSRGNSMEPNHPSLSRQTSDDKFNKALDILTRHKSRGKSVEPSRPSLSRQTSSDINSDVIEYDEDGNPRSVPALNYRDDPTDSTKMIDSGGATIDLLGESLGLSQRTPSAPPSNQFLDSDIPQDMRNQQAIDFNRYLGGNPYKIRNDVMEQADEQERLANVKEYDHYLSEIANMTRNAEIFAGADNVEGKKKGTEDDVKYGGDEQKAPASFDVLNPRGMRDQMKPKQAPDGSLDPEGGTPADNNEYRDVTNSGFNIWDLTPEQQNNYRSGGGLPAGLVDNLERVGRLADRSLVNSRANQLNSEGAGGSGIASEIASYVDLADAGNIGSRYGQRQSNGADDNSSFTTDDPRTLNERFSNMGMRRQGQKIDKYVNMKNKGMMYSNLMGKGVSDPSIQSIRDRKDDYIQPNGKHKGNSVNLIRQSNATSIRLNNMYMP